MEEDTEISIDDIKLWTVSALKDFLRKRNPRVTGRKEELVALVFAAKTMPELSAPSTSAAAADQEKKRHYGDLLKTPTGILPDPETLQDWESEANSITKWPPTMAFEIGSYLQNIDDVPLRKRLISDYKDQKAYSYFASGWMREVHYHPIDRDNKYCFLRTKCTPSQRVRDIPWSLWVALEKESGAVQSAFCTCFAGYSSTCNHVAALLFKIDFAWRHGLTNPACTSRECGWSAFAGKQSAEPQRIADMTWSKPQFSRQATSAQAEGTNTSTRRLFSPLSSRSMAAKSSLHALSGAMNSAFPDACCFQYMNVDVNQPPVPEVAAEEEVASVNIPPPLPSLASNFSSPESFLQELPIYTPAMTSLIEQMTRGQADSENWHSYRHGRITGSSAHAVLTRGRRLDAAEEGGGETDASNLVNRILGRTSVPSGVPALKYGREMEGEARNAYIKAQRSTHKKLVVTEGGLFLHHQHMYVGASPDGLVECECCGKGVLEIKCPFSISHTAPSHENVGFLEMNEDGTLGLKKSHQYFSQVQFQMGVLQRTWCDFFVYTRHGQLTVRVLLDNERWNELLLRSEQFFHREIAPALVNSPK